MNTIPPFFFKSWIRCVLTLVALGSVLTAVQLGMSWRRRPAVRSVLSAPVQETRVLPEPAPEPEAELPQMEIPVAATPKESSSVSVEVNVVAPAPATTTSFAGVETDVGSTASGQTVALPLARAVKIVRDAALVGVGSSGNGKTATVDPPLAFTVDPKNLTPEQQTALATIQDQFLKAIGDANQNPADPAYRERWINAQSIADQTYKALFGWTAFTQMQLERAGNSYTEIQLP